MSPEPARDDRPVGLAALGGFVLGAATVLVVVWFYVARPPRPPDVLPPVAVPAPLPAPAAPPSPGVALPAPSIPGPAPSADPDVRNLARRQLLLPVQGVRRESLVDSWSDERSGGRQHHAIDILAPRDTPILAVEDGTVVKLFTSQRGGLTVYQFDPSTTYVYYYAHLERYADGLQEGERLRRGQILGYVGTSGDAPSGTPHLHFEIMRLTPEKHWWQGASIDPFLVLHGSPVDGTLAGR